MRLRKEPAMAWKDHRESGEAVRTIRDWGFMKSKDRDDGGIDIIYGDEGGDTGDSRQHGHHGEDGSGVPDTRNRPPS